MILMGFAAQVSESFTLLIVMTRTLLRLFVLTSNTPFHSFLSDFVLNSDTDGMKCEL